jgi:DNA invertase Pin-like site-specific DNA recombinase
MFNQDELTMGNPLSPMGKVYSYYRYSSERQGDGHSMERQTRYAQTYAAEHGMILDEALTMRDRGLSAFHQKHVKSGALGEFLRDISEGLIIPGSVLIVEGLDRLSRAEPVVAQAQLAQIINAGITVVTVADGKTYSRESVKVNPMDLIYSLLVMIRAHEESETKSRRGKAALERLCQRWNEGTFRGRIPSGRDPKWVRYNTETKSYELVEPEASRVRRIIDLWLAGFSAARISRIFKTEGIDGDYSGPNLCPMLKYRAHQFIGTRVVMTNKTTEYHLKGYYPALIDEETYNALVSSTYNAPIRRGRDSIKTPCIFTGANGVMRCGYCNCVMAAAPIQRTKNGMGMRCTNDKCITRSVKMAPLEKAVIRFCSDQMNLNSLVGRDRATEIKSRISESRTILATLDKNLERVVEAMLATDKPPAAFTARATAIEDQIAALKEAIKVEERNLIASASAPTDAAAKKWQDLAEAALAPPSDPAHAGARLAIRKLVGATFNRIIFYRYGVNSPEAGLTWEDRPLGLRPSYSEIALVSKSGIMRTIRFDREGELIEMYDATIQACTVA